MQKKTRYVIKVRRTHIVEACQWLTVTSLSGIMHYEFMSYAAMELIHLEAINPDLEYRIFLTV